LPLLDIAQPLGGCKETGKAKAQYDRSQRLSMINYTLTAYQF
jgi:hypothetical protein